MCSFMTKIVNNSVPLSNVCKIENNQISELSYYKYTITLGRNVLVALLQKKLTLSMLNNYLAFNILNNQLYNTKVSKNKGD